MKPWKITIGDLTFTDDDLSFGDIVDVAVLTGAGYVIDPWNQPAHLLALACLFASRTGTASSLQWMDMLRALPAAEVLATLGEAVGDGN